MPLATRNFILTRIAGCNRRHYESEIDGQMPKTFEAATNYYETISESWPPATTPILEAFGAKAYGTVSAGE